MKPEVEIFTDGSCKKPQCGGGWAYILRLKDKDIEKRDSGGEASTTNNRQELTACIKAFEFLNKTGISCKVKLVSDSQYLLKGLVEWMPKWKKANWEKKNYETKAVEPVMNIDLWKKLDELTNKHELTTEWIKGHFGHVENEECDKMAGEAASVFYTKVIKCQN